MQNTSFSAWTISHDPRKLSTQASHAQTSFNRLFDFHMRIKLNDVDFHVSRRNTLPSINNSLCNPIVSPWRLTCIPAYADFLLPRLRDLTCRSPLCNPSNATVTSHTTQEQHVDGQQVQDSHQASATCSSIRSQNTSAFFTSASHALISLFLLQIL